MAHKTVAHPSNRFYPQLVTRVASLLYVVLAMICIASSKRLDGDLCPYNRSGNACRYPVIIGVVSVFILLGYLAIDLVNLACPDVVNLQKYQGYLLIMDVFLSGVFTFLWFLGLCYLTDQWRRVDIPDDYPLATAQAGIIFSFLSFFAFAGTTFLSTLQCYHKYYKDNDWAYASGC